MSETVHLVVCTAYLTITVNNADVIERVIGDGGDEWRSRFYGLETEEEVIEHLAFNFLTNGIRDVSRLEGWGDCDDLDVLFECDDIDFVVGAS